MATKVFGCMCIYTSECFIDMYVHNSINVVLPYMWILLHSTIYVGASDDSVVLLWCGGDIQETLNHIARQDLYFQHDIALVMFHQNSPPSFKNHLDVTMQVA